MEQLELDLRTDAEAVSDTKTEELYEKMEAWRRKMADPIYRKEFQGRVAISIAKTMKEQEAKDKQYQKNQREWWAKNKDRPIGF